MIVTEHVALSSETFVTLPAAKVLTVEVLVHGLGVFATPAGSISLRFGDGGDFVADVIFLNLTFTNFLDLLGLLFGNGKVCG